MAKKNKKSKKKAKKQAFISSIIRDGRITKKEAKKASKQGITMARIQKAQTKSFKPDNVFSNAKVSRDPSRMAPRQFAAGETLPARFSNNIARSYQQEHGGLGTYSPLVIQGSAQKVFDSAGSSSRSVRQPGVPSGPNVKVDPAPSPQTQPPEDPALTALREQNELLQQQLNNIPDFESIFAQQAEQAAAQRAQDMQDLQNQQQRYMEEMAARQAEQERERRLTFQTSQQNMARAGMRPDFRIGTQAARDRLGTGGFKRRRKAMKAATIAQGILPAAAAASNATGNLLNV
tara:strand:+ start:250 stop:1119 length:870 start_codon:yes stop_codon:yes gene_type:complete